MTTGGSAPRRPGGSEAYTISATRRIAAPAQRVYDIIADYHEGHPSILPPKWFPGLVVEQGGRGAGTIIRFQMRVLGTTQTIRSAVTEPEPGRVLVETDLERGTVTRFIVDGAGDDASSVTFETTPALRPGLAGRLERALLTWMLPRVYRDELAQLAHVAERGTRGG